MKKTLVLCCCALAMMGAVSTANAATVEEIIASHIEAKGGAEAWAAIENMKVTGEFTAFSKVSPFTLHKARDNRYHLDHTMNDRKVVIGYDGELRWWENGFTGGGPQAMTNPVDLEALERELDFATPFFDYEARGFEVELLEDKTEIEGFDAIAIKLTRGEGSEETWYLDPETHLELARESPGSDFGRPMPSTTFFDEFQEVAGVMIPYYVETQWYTRDRVMNVSEVEVNVDLDDRLFSLAVATGMELFQHMVGEWDVKVEAKQSPRQPEFTESTRESSITASLNGGLIEERYDSEGASVVRTVSYDRYREHYVLTQMNDLQTFLDIQVGEMVDDALTVSNVDTDTSYFMFGTQIHERSTISDVTENGFSVQRENSMDGGQNWAVMQKLTYTRKAE